MDRPSRFPQILTLLLAFGTPVLPVSAEEEQADEAFPVPTGPYAEAAELLNAALDDARVGEDSEEQAVRMEAAIRSALPNLAPETEIAERLESALKQAEKVEQSEQRYKALVEAGTWAATRLSFQPIKEAELPDGFPTFTPPGVIEVKDYPVYRMAKGKRFFTLFGHIKTNGIAMTAPVQMSFAENDAGRMKQESMAFLYGSKELGKTGSQGAVEVVDTDPMTVVSVGVLGDATSPQIVAARERLERWIERSSDYERTGVIRVMGYNSPFVPSSKRLIEVQIPVRKVEQSRQ